MHAAHVTRSDQLHQAYRACHPDLLRFCAARTGDAAEAEDVIQDLWLRVETRRPGPVDNPRSYLFRMANNIIVDRQREARRRQLRDRMWSEWEADLALAGLQASDCAETRLIEAEEAAILKRSVDDLPQGARAVLQLHTFDGLSHGEVAERLGISRSGVEKHMAVAMKHLRRMLLAA
jgi:RNA polymerase sigma factor (sigma-70 family)